MFSKKNTTILKKNRILIKPKCINIRFPFTMNKCVTLSGCVFTRFKCQIVAIVHSSEKDCAGAV